MSLRTSWHVVLLAASLSLGCGDGRTKFDVAPTDGRVLCEGQPVPYVTVYFEPLPDGNKSRTGKSAVGYADEKGTFVLTTYDNNDGAVVGKHRVRVGPPMGANSSGFKCDCVVSETNNVMELQVESGRNSFEITLTKATPEQQAAAAQRAATDAEIDD